MKKSQGIMALIIIICGCLVLYLYVPLPTAFDDFNKRALWVDYSDLERLDYHSSTAFESGFNEVIERAKDNKCNTLIVHVRAFQDALYPSDLFPLSKVITSSEIDFDPLDIMISLCHQSGMTFEAWVNPYRISNSKKTYHQFMESDLGIWLNDDDKIIQWDQYDCMLNPANQDVIDYIVAGIGEIIENYEVDGIHFDDYFYDSSHYHRTSKNQRLENVDKLVKQVYRCIKDYDKSITFGISPQGNVENCLNDGADVSRWLSEEGYVDYIMPQIYWSNDYNQTTLFSDTLEQWLMLKRNDVDLYVGLALYHAGEDLKKDKGWSESDHNLLDQIEILKEYGISGYSLFHYQNLLESDGQKEMKNLLDNLS